MELKIEITLGFEAMPCEICGNDTRELIAARTDLFLGGDTLYSMYKCQKCHAIYQYPRPCPEKMVDFYPPDYQQYTRAVHEENRLASYFRRYGLRKRCDIVTKHVPKGRLLDVGCATGDFLSEMRLQSGWQVAGIEPIFEAAQYAQREVGLDVVQGVLNEVPYPPESFDAITMWDVIEHVYDPLTVIKQVAQLLRPNGVLVVNHPNVDSIDRKIFGNLWLGYELPRHLYLFPGDLLKELMNTVELSEVERRCIYGSHAATSSSLMFVLEKRLNNERVVQWARKILFSKGFRLLATPYFKYVDSRRQGSNITAVFRKIN